MSHEVINYPVNVSPSWHVTVDIHQVPNTGTAARWQSHRFELASVSLDEEGAHEVRFYKDDAEGYWLNLQSPNPCWFVMWRMEDAAGNVTTEPVVNGVSLSYHDAGRWLDSQERVEQIPIDPRTQAAVLLAMTTFVDAHYTVEEKKRKRPQSFQSLTDRFGNPARIST